MKAMPWIKQYPSRLHDVRIAELTERQQLRYYQLYLLAGHLNADGAFVHQDGKIMTPKEIGFFLRVKDTAQLAKDIAALKKSGLLKANGHGPFIADFRDEQINWVEKQNAERERKRQSRISHKNVTRDTSSGHTVVPLLEREEEEDKELDLDLEKKKKQNTPSPLFDNALDKFSKAKISVSEKEREKLAALLPSLKEDWILKAIRVAVQKNKLSAAYVIGILQNWRDEHANNSSNRNKQSADKPTQSGGPSPKRSAATSAAAKLVIDRKRKASV